MSEARQPALPIMSGLGAAAGRVGRMAGHVAHLAVLAVLSLALVAALALAGLAWRLSQGPVDVTGLVRWAETHRAEAGDRVHLRRATLAWAGFERGAGRAFQITMHDLLMEGTGGTEATLRDFAADISVAGLMRGQAEPRSLVVRGASIKLVREADGTIHLDRGVAPAPAMATGELDLPPILAALTRPPGADDSGDGPPGLRQLRRVVIEDAVIELTDARYGTLRAMGRADLQREAAGGVRGTAQAELVAGAAQGTLTLTAGLDAAGGTSIEAMLTPIDLAALARSAPGLAPLAALSASVGGRMQASLTPGFVPRRVALQAAAGGGTVHAPQPAGAEVVMPFESLAMDAVAEWDGSANLPARLVLSRIQAVVASPSGGWPTTAVGAATLTRSGETIHGEGSLGLDHVAMADLPKLWPQAWGGHARPWIVENITGGTARNGRLTAQGDIRTDLTAPKLGGLTVDLIGDDVTIHWLRPVPPVEHLQAVLTMRTPDTLVVTATGGRQGAMALSGGVVRITGLSVKDQDMSINTDVAGPVPELLTLLKHPRLNLLSTHPLPVQRPAGAITGKLTVTLPLENDLSFDQVGIHAAAQLSGLRLGGVVAGKDIDRAEVAIDVTQDGLRATGSGAVAGLQSQIGLEMDFRGGAPGQVVQRATLAGRATPRQLAQGGLDPGALMPGGTVALNAEYAQRRDGRATVEARADLREAQLALPGWTKPAGLPARASAKLVLLRDKLQGITDVHAEGPGMRVDGRAEMVGAAPSRLVLERIQLGRTQAQGEISIPGEAGGAVRVTLSGTDLDLSDQFRKTEPRPREPAPAPQRRTPFVADIRFGRVVLAGGHSIGTVTAHAEHDGTRLHALRLQSGGAERLQVLLAPVPGGRKLSVRTADGGAVLQALDVSDSLVGGSFALEGQYDDRTPASPLTGTADLSEFHVRNAPAVGKLLQALTVYGLAEAFSGPGLKFSRAIAPFVYSGDQLYLGESQAFSASLGLTAKGLVDLGRNTLDMSGTIVPLYALNSALGRLPGMAGRLFSPEKGGGLFSVSYGLHGALADPSVAVNPLSILTPGLMRRLFRVFN